MRIFFIFTLGLFLAIGCCSLNGPDQIVIDDIATLEENRNRAREYVEDLNEYVEDLNKEESVKTKAKEKYDSAVEGVNDWLKVLETAITTTGNLTKPAPQKVTFYSILW